MAARILCQGDSITEGQGVAAPTLVNGGYRLMLYNKALAADRILHLVGPVTINSAGMTYPGHAGYTGTDVQTAINKIASTDEDAAYPDVMLLDIGNNNVKNGNDLTVFIQLYDTLLTNVCAKWPTVRIICSTIGPYDTPYVYCNAPAATINTYIRKLTTNHPLSHRILLADIAATLTVGGLGDGLHPNSAGYDVMATVWWSVLSTIV